MPDADAAESVLRNELRAGDVVLVKASRAASLERVASLSPRIDQAVQWTVQRPTVQEGRRRVGVKTILIAAVVALIASILFTPLVVAFFRRRGFGQEIRIDGPQSHLIKRGTPTMGGVAIVGSTVAGYTAAHLSIAINGGGGPNASGVLAAAADGRAAVVSGSSTTSSRSAGSAASGCGRAPSSAAS